LTPNHIKLGAAGLALVLLIVFLQGTIFGGGGDDDTPSVSRPSSIPTATPPANLPEPLLLGEARGTTSTTAAATGGEGTYTVKAGDSLSAIASSLNVPPDQQAAWIAEVLRLNGIADVRLLAVGQVIRLPRITAATGTATPSSQAAAGSPTATRPATTTTPVATATPAATATQRPTVAASGQTYTVVSGDYPGLIAEKLGVPAAQQSSWADQLLALNNVCSSCLQVGQVLQLPAGTPTTPPPPTPVPATPTPAPPTPTPTLPPGTNQPPPIQ
jgi:LysM repeat protein